MKIFINLLFCLFFVVIALSSCKNSKSDEVRDQARESLGVQAPTTQPGAAQPAASPALTSNVKHYTCPNNCAGSGGDVQGTCPVCGSAYVHNQAYHDQQNAASPAVTTTPTAPTAAPTPAQNAAGVYHYTCTKGCAGGAGATGNCATCGAPLAHNQAYHQ